MPDAGIFHAGTAMKDGQLVTAGGRVLASPPSPPRWMQPASAYEAIDKIHFEGMQFRRDMESRPGGINDGRSGPQRPEILPPHSYL